MAGLMNVNVLVETQGRDGPVCCRHPVSDAKHFVTHQSFRLHVNPVVLCPPPHTHLTDGDSERKHLATNTELERPDPVQLTAFVFRLYH